MVSFDFACTKTRPNPDVEEEPRSALWMVMVDSQTGAVHCVPLSQKSKFKLAVRELLNFTTVLGYTETGFMAGNEPSTREVLRLLVQARHAL